MDDLGLLAPEPDEPDEPPEEDDEPEEPTVTVVSWSYEHPERTVLADELDIPPPYTTDGPGFGKTGSEPSCVVHVPSANVLARKRPGPVKDEAEDPAISTTAQFMYSSRLPTRLNQVHAKVAFLAEGRFDGIGMEYESCSGQPPMML